ncbi:MAG: DNA mismatch repair protein MutS, partial [Defluviitaleaceae bacterium]|nr:DNA mismatch repair protein MutS [Defluviitaleaceae bacterium]
VAYCDISTGEFYGAKLADFTQLTDEIARVEPVEVITCFTFANEYEIELKSRIHPFGGSVSEGLLDYLRQTGLEDLSHIKEIELYEIRSFMLLDKYVRRGLELFETQLTKESQGSLLCAMDATKTPMGRRQLKKWMEQPLLKLAEINVRLDAVGELAQMPDVRSQIRESLAKIGDLEGFCGKIAYKRTSGRDLTRLARGLGALRELVGAACGLEASLNAYFAAETDTLDDIFESIHGVVLAHATNDIDQGGIFVDGYNADLDRLRARRRELDGEVSRYVQELRAQIGVNSLKVGQNKVLGHFIEVPNSHRDKIPADWLNRQSLSSCQRLSTERLKVLQMQIETVHQEICDLEYGLFIQLRNGIAAQMRRIQGTARAVAHFDCIQSLAEIADIYNYVKPEMAENGDLEIVGGRHPVIERTVEGFVPNDLKLVANAEIVAQITGPNMAGKSTYMRQNALIAIMAQMGSFVPAVSAKLPVFDGIFARIGAGDDISRGQSTFMVEMTELAHILQAATGKSLILLDEVGRGTSTSDGLAIAAATVRHIAEIIGARTLFATHFHELVWVTRQVGGVLHLYMDVIKSDGGIEFLRKVRQGWSGESFGLSVAEMAGLPEELLTEATEIRTGLEGEKWSGL